MRMLWIACALITAAEAAPEKSISIKKHPYILELLHDKRHWCGAVLISTKIVLSTAYCVYKISKRNLTIVAGSSIPENAYVKQYKVSSTYRHKKYSPARPGYDISVIFPETPIEADGKFVVPIQVAEMHYLPGTKMALSGWKLIENRPVLISTKLQLKGERRCANDYKKLNITVAKGELCAYEGNGAACRGDSGGALIVKNKLVGLVSRIFYPTCTHHPGIYTCFFHFKPFIKNVVKKVLRTQKTVKMNPPRSH